MNASVTHLNVQNLFQLNVMLTRSSLLSVLTSAVLRTLVNARSAKSQSPVQPDTKSVRPLTTVDASSDLVVHQNNVNMVTTLMNSEIFGLLMNVLHAVVSSPPTVLTSPSVPPPSAQLARPDTL